MVNQVVPRDQLVEYTLEMAKKIATKPSFALKLTKEAVNQSIDAQGQWQAMQAVFNLHQLAHSHWAEMSGGKARMDMNGLPGLARK